MHSLWHILKAQEQRCSIHCIHSIMHQHQPSKYIHPSLCHTGFCITVGTGGQMGAFTARSYKHCWHQATGCMPTAPAHCAAPCASCFKWLTMLLLLLLLPMPTASYRWLCCCWCCCGCFCCCLLPCQLLQVAAHLLVLGPVAGLVLLAAVVSHLEASKAPSKHGAYEILVHACRCLGAGLIQLSQTKRGPSTGRCSICKHCSTVTTAASKHGSA
jgi:hypothetical protein